MIMAASARELLESLFRTAVAAAHPSQCLPPNLPEPPPRGRLVVLAAGKAAGSMTQAAEQHYLGRIAEDRLTGIAVTRHGYGRPTPHIPVVEAGHPVPDEAGLQGTEQALALAEAAGGDDLVLVLLSGGASANWIAPAKGITLAEKQAVTRALLRSGAAIGDMNALRKHLSRIKGGRLARLAFPAKLVTLAISDVPGDDPSVIGSGPTVPDPTTLEDARAIVARFRLDLPATVAKALDDPGNETPKPGDSIFAGSDYRIVARPADALQAAQGRAIATGYECIVLGDRLQGEAREVAAEHARLARDLSAQGRRVVILSGGELTVTLQGQGRGGRFPALHQHAEPGRRRGRLQRRRRLDHRRLVEPAVTNLRDRAQGQSRRALLLCLRHRLRSWRRMDGTGLYVRSRQGIHHPRHWRLPGPRL